MTIRDMIKPFSLLTLKNLLAITFLYHLFFGILIQFFFLPVVFPSFHAGEGMLAGGDWSSFHRIARELAAEMETSGTSTWLLRPQGQAPAGITALFYYYLTPSPWVLLPFNAFIHTLSTCLLFFILRSFLSSSKACAIGSVAFAFFPSSFTWTTQIHKDGFSILGFLACVYGWLLFEKEVKPPSKYPIQRKLLGMLLIACGIASIWIVRPYLVGIMKIIFLIALLISFVVRLAESRSQLGLRDLDHLALLCLTLCSLNPNFLSTNQTSISFESPRSSIVSDNANIGEESILHKEDVTTLPKSSTTNSERKGFFEDLLDRKIYALNKARGGFQRVKVAGSNIDTEVYFSNWKEMIAYIPRALQIVLLAPFPADWTKDGTLESNTLMRRVAGIEMLITYFSFLFFFIFCSKQYRNYKFICTAALAFSFLIALSLVVCNVGTLYRMRYAGIHVIIAFGLGFFAQAYGFRILTFCKEKLKKFSIGVQNNLRRQNQRGEKYKAAS